MAELDDWTPVFPDDFQYPLDGYEVPTFPLRDTATPYLEQDWTTPRLLARLQDAFASTDIELFKRVLHDASDVIASGVEHERAEAKAAWGRREVWVPTIADDGPARPAEDLIDSITLLGTSTHEPRGLCAAVGLWCCIEYYETSIAGADGTWMLEQTAFALSEADYYKGMEAHASASAAETTRRHSVAAEKGSLAKKVNKTRGFQIWGKGPWRVQADAEREIAKQCNITQTVAGRWIRDYKHAPDAYRELQSKYSALLRP